MGVGSLARPHSCRFLVGYCHLVTPGWYAGGVKKLTPNSLALVLAKRVGFWNGARVLVFIVAWGMMTDAVGRPESIEAYSRYWGQSDRTSYRELAAFRKALPGEVDPARIWELVRAEVPTDAEEGPAVLGAIAPERLLIAGL